MVCDCLSLAFVIRNNSLFGISAIVENNADASAEYASGMFNTYLLHHLLLGVVQLVHIVTKVSHLLSAHCL